MIRSSPFGALEDEDRGLLGVGGPLLSHAVAPPHAELDGDSLVWSVFGEDADAWSTERDTDGLLDAFQRIREPADVPPFVLRYGSIKICEHNLPMTHVPVQWDPAALPPHGEAFLGPGPFTEPTSRWLHYSRLARGILEVASTVYDDPPRTPRREVWESIFEDNPAAQSAIDAASRAPFIASQQLSVQLNEWLILGDVGPLVIGSLTSPTDSDPPIPTPPTLRLASPSTFGLIGLQLIQAVTRSRDLHNCSGCGLFYERRGRKAKTGQRNYCPTCRARGIPQRDRQRDWRVRHPQARGGDDDEA